MLKPEGLSRRVAFPSVVRNRHFPPFSLNFLSETNRESFMLLKLLSPPPNKVVVFIAAAYGHPNPNSFLRAANG